MIRSRILAVLLVAAVPSASRAEDAPSYQRQIVPLFSKLGCNAGTCHGAVRGQGGFRLSLFAADPDGDRARLLREFGGRRLDFANPDASLLLRKATGQSEHGGGVRVRTDSAEYAMLRRWIAAGAPADAAERGMLAALNISPADRAIAVGERYALKVEATFADGTREDVAALCTFESLDAGIASVDAAGHVAANAVGDCAIVVRYRGQPAMARVLVPRAGAAAANDVSPANFVDAQVLAKLKSLNLPAAALADDATFLRRASLDIAGELPTPSEVRAFLADRSLGKRAAKIDELLARPGHAALWTMKFCDVLKAADYGVYADALTLEQDAPRFQAWVRARMEENTPYDQFVERILLATSRDGRDLEEYAAEVKAMLEGFGPSRNDLDIYRKRRTLDLFWQRRGADGVGGTQQVAHAFLGLRLECAQCHRHPHDVWQQDDLLDFANFFMGVRRVGFEGDNEKRFPDAAAVKKRFDDDAKKLEAEVKSRKEGEGKNWDAAEKAAKANVARLSAELARLEKEPMPDASTIAAKRKELDATKASLAAAEMYRQETAVLERRAKLYPEVGRRLLQAEVRIVPNPKFASVTSPIGTKESRTFRLLGEKTPASVPANTDPRRLVMDWLRRPDNPFFARALVNRVWAHYFGRGIIDPPDNLSSFNPATHPELLDELCRGFIANKYDLRWLHRTIANSRTYQQANSTAPGSSADRANYSSFALRRLPAEVLLDALNAATGTTDSMNTNFWPANIKTVEVPFRPNNPFVAFVLEQYGRPNRNSAVQCDCERDNAASVLQVLALANHPEVLNKIRSQNGRVAKLLKEVKDDAGRIEELFLATVSRPPNDDERSACLKYIAAAESPEKGYQGVLWSLINTREFLLQH